MFSPTTHRLLGDLNKAKRLNHGDIGYSYFADIKGDGTFSPRIYEVVNTGGGVCLSSLNNANPRKRCQAIRAAINAVAYANLVPPWMKYVNPKRDGILLDNLIDLGNA